MSAAAILLAFLAAVSVDGATDAGAAGVATGTTGPGGIFLILLDIHRIGVPHDRYFSAMPVIDPAIVVLII